MIMYLLSTEGVLGLEPHRGGSKDTAASGQNISQEHREKKLLSKGYARGEVTAIKRLNP